MSADESNALKILDYWFTMEFLNQQSLRPQKDAGNAAFKYKNAFAKGLVRRKKSLTDFIQMKPGDTLAALAEQNAQRTGLPAWGGFTVFIGRMQKEACIQAIAQNVDWEDLRPENNTEDIALAALRLGKDGRYKAGSLELSPLAWAMKRLAGGTENASQKLSAEAYNKDTRALEEELGELLAPEELPMPGDTPVPEELPAPGELPVPEAGLAPRASLLRWVTYDLLFQIEKRVCETLGVALGDAAESFLAVYYTLWDEEPEPGGEDETSLHFDCFSDDLAMVAEKLRKGELGAAKKAVLLDYILGIQKEGRQPGRFDIVKPESRKALFAFLRDTLTARRAPLGKWPSRFMPALMQQIAVNLAVDEEHVLPVFSVNGPPGTGKTTLLKEIIVNHIVRKAVLLADYADPDEAFDDRNFTRGEGPQHAYNKYVPKYHRLKNDAINHYSILVTSSNNTAVENITKELPVEKKLLGDIAPSKNGAGKNDAALAELTHLFTVSESEDRLVHTEQRWETYTDAGGQKKRRQKTVTVEEPDIYFSSLATELLNDAAGEDGQVQAFGLISASLGKRSNITKAEKHVIEPLLAIMKKNESIEKAKEAYIRAREEFLNQLAGVEKLQKEQDILVPFLGCDYGEEIKEHQKNAACLQAQREKAEAAVREAEEALQTIEETIVLRQSSIQAVSGRVEALKGEVNVLDRLMKTEKYKKNQTEREEALQMQARYAKELDASNQEHQAASGRLQERKAQAAALKERAAEEEKELADLCARRDASARALAAYKAREDYEKGFILNQAFIDDILSEDVETGTEAQVRNPWFSEHYNREREKLFLYALRMTKMFILGSKKCRDNLKHLYCLWSGGYEDGVSVRFSGEDLEACTAAAYETLFLLIPVLSSTFASVQNLFRDVRQEDLVGTLIVDEAGQASPHMAIGALYRSRRAVIVGDPRQVEPVVTDDQDLLRRTYTGELFRLYADKTHSVQRFADRMNPYGTYLDDNAGGEEWVGCPLLVHRRCISPMYDISNAISYNNIMKQKTLPPKPEKEAGFLFEKSLWMNVAGREAGRKNHFVPEQGEQVAALLERAFEKSENPDVYIISPFKSVVAGVTEYIKNYAKAHPDSPLAKAAPRSLFAWLGANIGTVHKFQGKEAAEVIFLLGCDTSPGALPAVRWVNNNIVNVAATRAKYRLYIIGDIQAWKESRCVSRAKAIMDTYAFEAIDKELQKEQPDAGKLAALGRQIPAGSAFPVQQKTGEDGEEAERIPSTAEMLAELDKTAIRRDLSASELARFGFQNISEVQAFSSEIRSNLLWGMKLYLLAEKISEKTEERPDAACCGILFCKAIELRMYECFADALKHYFPDYVMRPGQGASGAQKPACLKDAEIEEFTLGWYSTFFKKKKAALGDIMRRAGHPEYGADWWSAFRDKLFSCKNERNLCCHAKSFPWSNLEVLLHTIFADTAAGHQGTLKGLLFESRTGLLMQETEQGGKKNAAAAITD